MLVKIRVDCILSVPLLFKYNFNNYSTHVACKSFPFVLKIILTETKEWIVLGCFQSQICWLPQYNLGQFGKQNSAGSIQGSVITNTNTFLGVGGHCEKKSKHPFLYWYSLRGKCEGILQAFTECPSVHSF